MADFQTHWGFTGYQPLLQDRLDVVNNYPAVVVLYVCHCFPLD